MPFYFIVAVDGVVIDSTNVVGGYGAESGVVVVLVVGLGVLGRGVSFIRTRIVWVLDF